MRQPERSIGSDWCTMVKKCLYFFNNIIDGLVVDHERAVGVLQGSMAGYVH